jgi:hypothetical protein
MCQGKRIGKKKKTTVKTANLNPYYNESFVFVVEEMSLKKVSLLRQRLQKNIICSSLISSGKNVLDKGNLNCFTSVIEKGWLQQCSIYAFIVEVKFLDCIPGVIKFCCFTKAISLNF